MKRNIIALFLLLFYSNRADACSVCFSNVTDDPMVNGLKWAILTLLLITGFVLCLIAKFFLRIRKHEKLILTPSQIK